MRKALLYTLLTIALCRVSTANGAQTRARSPGQRFSFAVLADPRSQGDTWRNALLEIRDREARQKARTIPTELIICAGDMDPLAARYEDFQSIFTNAETRPVFLPVIGNHEFDDGGAHFRFARDILIPSIPAVVRRHAASCDYYLDHKNARIIVVDGYTDLGTDGVINDKGRQWVEKAIKAAPSSIEHIFIAFHEPAFARFKHAGDSFDADPERRNAFWQMLLQYTNKVRAVLAGHDHTYSRMRVLDPAGISANDVNTFPDEAGGIYQVNAGTAGRNIVNTIVQVQIEGRSVLFSAFQAQAGSNEPFSAIDEWRFN